MAERLGEALLDLDTDDKKFVKGIGRAKIMAESFGNDLDTLKRRAVIVGQALGVAGAIGGAAFAKGITEAIGRVEEFKKASAQVDQALKNSGNTANTSAVEIAAWADKLEERTGRAGEEVMAVSANLASFGFGEDIFFRAIELADDMSAAWGGDLRENIEGLSRALDDPINGMAMLSKRGVKLTEDQKALAKQFFDTGQKADAQKVVLKALEDQVKGVAEAGFGGLTKALALAQKRWDDAFESLVTGEGGVRGLDQSLARLVDTVSSPEFIDAAVTFGAALTEAINIAAQAIIFTWQKAEAFLKWLDGQKPNEVASSDIPAEIARLEELQKLAASDKSSDWFMGPLGAGSDARIAGYQKQIDALKTELAGRAPVDTSQTDIGKTFDQLTAPSFGNTAQMFDYLKLKSMKGSGGGGGGTGDGLAAQSDALKQVLEDLRNEAQMVGLNAQQQAILNAQRQAGVTATSAAGKEIENLIKGTDLATAALERQRQAYELLGSVGRTVFDGLVSAMEDGKVTGKEFLGVLGDVLKMGANFFIQQGISGLGKSNPLGTILSSFFAGGFATGGLIPAGKFGIVGENGPEPIIGTSRGAMVLPNSSLSGMGRGNMTVHINGSGLSQSELTHALSDAFDRYDRFTLPGRVAAINRDPLARG